MTEAIKGGLAGFLATLPMSIVMSLLYERLPHSQKEPLPPRRITMNAAKKTGLHPKLTEPEKQTATLVGHFGYGSLMGVLYGSIARKLRLAGVGGGIGYGLAVWLGSYGGYLPMIGLYRPLKKEAPKRAWLMIAAHVVWGAALSLSLRALTPSGSTSSGTRAAV